MTFGSSTAPTQRSPHDASWTLLHVLGIPLRVRRSFLVIVAAVAAMGAMNGCSASHDPTKDLLAAATGAAVSLIYLAGLFLVVILHEFGHALVARAHGVEVVEVAVWPLGGVAMLRNMPEDASIEARVSFAGPAVNLVLALVLGAIAMLSGASSPAPGGSLDFGSILAFGIYANLALGLFNLIPAFPMDGGKVLRAWLGRKGDWLGATERAVRIGRMFCWMMLIAAFYYGHPILGLISLYLIFAGAREVWFMRLRHATSGGPEGAGFGFGTGPIADMLRKMQAQGQGQPDGGSFEDGVPDDGPIIDIEPNQRPSGGFSDEEVRQLERNPGRLRRPD